MGRVSLLKSNSTCYRFAVKFCKFDEPAMRAAFVQELLLWIDLPHHPYLAPCYFFRSLGDGVAIFSEYFESGSLADWISDHRLGTVKELLDIALCTARGLAFLHELGYVHRDFKPRNVLMEKNGTPRIADFGLAVPGLLVNKSQWNVPGGMTAAYRSPEQAACTALGPPTDMWSWAVSVLELFVGQVTWLDGQVAGNVLEKYLTGIPGLSTLVIPQTLVEILRRCFKQNPDERWQNMDKVADRLKGAYESLSAVAPVTILPEASSPAPPLRHIDSSNPGVEWFSPDWWNNLLCARDALNVGPRKPLYLPVGSRNGRALADLVAYAEIEDDLRRLAATDAGLRGNLVAFYGNKGNIHLALGDCSRAIEVFDRAFVIGRELMSEGDRHAADLLLSIYAKKAVALNMQGDIPAMGRMFEEADAERLADRYINPDAFAFFQLRRANYASRSGRREQTYEIIDSVISSLLAKDSQDLTAQRALSLVFASKAEISNQWGRNTEALQLLDRAIEICEDLLSTVSDSTARDDRRTVVSDSAKFRTLRASILVATGRAEEGIPEIRLALRDLQSLIHSGETQHSSEWRRRSHYTGHCFASRKSAQ